MYAAKWMRNYRLALHPICSQQDSMLINIASFGMAFRHKMQSNRIGMAEKDLITDIRNM